MGVSLKTLFHRVPGDLAPLINGMGLMELNPRGQIHHQRIEVQHPVAGGP